MIQLCRYFDPQLGPRLAAHVDGAVIDLSAAGDPALASLSAWLKAVDADAGPAHERFHSAVATQPVAHPLAALLRAPDSAHPHLLPPIDQQEVWAAGVTYLRSRDAREEESAGSGIYDRVYDADRPEIFLKATPQRVVGPADHIYIRGDSDWNVPEPELTAVFTPQMHLVGYTVGNDVSSRDIEGANPLYLPQAKTYARSCALGPAITLVEDVTLPVTIQLTIERAGTAVFSGQIATDQMKRTVPELAAYLGRYNHFPHGALLMTGTGLVPPDDFTLSAGDLVHITIDPFGTLSNRVKVAPL